jgi:uncharacterized membrane protein YtjA (UPF0391 family)
MLRWAAIFFVVAIVAGLLGFWGLESSAATIAKLLFFAFIIIAVVSLLMGRRAV